MSLAFHRRLMRPAGLLLAAGAALSLSRAALAQYAWVPTTASGGTWSTAANWAPGAPVSGIDTTLTFSNPYLSAGYSCTNDIVGNFDLNAISMVSESRNPVAGSSFLTVGSAAGSTVTFNTSSTSTGPSLSIDGAGVGAFASSTLLAANLAVNATNVGQLSFTGSIANAGVGTRDVTVNVGNALFTWNPSSTAGWTGNLNLSGGTLALGGTGSLGSNTLVVNGGALRVGVSGAIASNVTLNSDLRITAFTANTGLFTGSLSGAGGINVSPQTGTNNTLQLEGSSGFTGAVTINGFNTSAGAISLRNTAGALTGATTYNVVSNSTLTLDNSAAVYADRVRNDATLNLHRGNLSMLSNASTASSETIGTVAFSGMSTALVNNSTAGAGAATTLTIGSLARTDRGTLSVSGSNLGAAPAGTGIANLKVTGSLASDLGGGGASSGTTQSILPYAVGRNLLTAGSMDAHVVVGPDGLRPLTMGEYNQGLYLLRGTTSQQNVAVRNDLAGTATTAFTGAWIDRRTTVNALLLNGLTSASNVGTGLYGPTSLGVTSGSIVMGNSGGTAANLGPATIGVSTLDFGATEGIIHANAGLPTAAASSALLSSTSGAAIASVVAGSNGLTKSGLGALTLNGVNTFTGQVTVNAGTLNISSDANLGDASNTLRLNGGSSIAVVNSNSVAVPSLVVFQPSNIFGDGTAQTMSMSRSIVLGASGGGVGVASSNAELTVSGGVSGPGTLLIGSQIAGGLVNLTGVNTHSGGTVVNGQLAINSDSALGSGTLMLEAGSVLRPTVGTTALSISNSIRADGGTNIFTPAGSTMTLNGPLLLSSNTNLSFTKFGAGALEITAPSQMASAFALGSGAPSVVGSQSQFEAPGQVVLRGNGTLAAAVNYTLNEQSELVLDNTATNVNNRISASAMNLAGGAITLKGNASQPTAEAIGAVTFNGLNGQALITVKPNAAQNASLTMPSQAANSSGISWVLVRGDSLGAAPGAGVANVYIGTTPTGAMGSGSAPILTNNVIPGFVASASSTGDATSFATYSTTQGVQPLAAYSSGASLANFAATNNVDLATPQTLTAATAFSANALRIRGSATLDLNGDTLTLGTGMLLSTRTGGTTLAGGGTLSLTGAGMIYNTTDLNMGTTVIAGGANFNKGGLGVLTLANANPALTGNINVGAGTLRLSAAGSLPTTASVFIQPSILGDAKFDLNGFNVSIARVSGLGSVDLGSGGSLAVTSSFTSLVNISGTGRTVGGPALRLGSGGTITGLSSFTGQTVLGGGTTTVLANTPAGGAGNGPFGSSSEPIQVGDAATTATTTLSIGAAVDSFNRNIVLPSAAAGGAPVAQITAIQSSGGSGTVNIGSNISTGRSLRLAGTSGSFTAGQATISGVISNNGSDAGSVEFNTGNWNLTGNNTYSGGTTLANTTGAMLGLGHDNALGTGNISISAGAGTLRATGGSRSIANNIAFTAAATNGLGIAGVNDINFSGTVNLGSTAQRFNILNTGKTTFSGAISGGPASGVGFTKTGGGTLVFSNGNTITGDTRIAAGAMLANNASGSAFGAGVVTVDPAAILGGSGFISGNVVLSAGGVMAPGVDVGASIGTLTVGGLSTVGGSIFTFDLQDQNNPATNDLIALTGGLTSISGIVDICPKPGFVAGIFPLFTYSGSQLTSGGLTLTPGFLTAYPSAFIDYTTQANTVLLNVPSPGAFALLSFGGVLAARRRRQ